mgnify:FL=1
MEDDATGSTQALIRAHDLDLTLLQLLLIDQSLIHQSLVSALIATDSILYSSCSSKALYATYPHAAKVTCCS